MLIKREVVLNIVHTANRTGFAQSTYTDMSLLVAVTLCVLVAMASASTPKALPREYEINKAPELFATFMAEHHRTYKNEEDKAEHYKAFVENLKKINEQNKMSTSATFGINKFADYTAEERKQMFGFGVSKTKN